MRILQTLFSQTGAEEYWAGALNWATGETVAVKEIQLSNIPKGELGEIMVSNAISHRVFHLLCPLVRDRSAQEFKCEGF